MWKMLRLFAAFPGALADAVGEFAGGLWRQFTPLGQLMLVFALIATAVDAGISYKYGVSMTGLHGWGFALLAIGMAIFPDLAIRAYKDGNRAGAGIIAAGLVILTPVAYQSHIGYGAGVRSGDMQETAFSQVKFDDVRKGLDGERASIATFRAQLAALLEQNAWAASVSADGLRTQVKALKRSEEAEARLGGCKAKCRAIQNEIAKIEGQISVAEKASDLTNRIEATQRVIDSKSQVASTTQVRASTVVNQNDALVRIFNVVSGQSPEDAVQVSATAQQFVSIFTAGSAGLAFMILAPLFWIGAGLNRRPDADDHFPPSAPAPVTLKDEAPAHTSAASPFGTAKSETKIINNTFTDQTFAEAWAAAQNAVKTRHAHA
jgi:hypothetical protein